VMMFACFIPVYKATKVEADEINLCFLCLFVALIFKH
jgi:hypothetical protein